MKNGIVWKGKFDNFNYNCHPERSEWVLGPAIT